MLDRDESRDCCICVGLLVNGCEVWEPASGEFKQNLCKMSIESVYVKILWRGSKGGKLLYTSCCVSSPPTIVLN